VIIRGPSGGGKTTLLNMFGTIDSLSGGELTIFGKNIHELKSDEELSQLRLEKIGFVFQTFNLLATMSAYENVELPMSLLGKLSSKQIKRRVKRLLCCNFVRQSTCLELLDCKIGRSIYHQNFLEVSSRELLFQERFQIDQSYCCWMSLLGI